MCLKSAARAERDLSTSEWTPISGFETIEDARRAARTIAHGMVRAGPIASLHSVRGLVARLAAPRNHWHWLRGCRRQSTEHSGVPELGLGVAWPSPALRERGDSLRPLRARHPGFRAHRPRASAGELSWRFCLKVNALAGRVCS